MRVQIHPPMPASASAPALGHGAVGLESTLIGVVSLPAPSLSLCNLA